MAADSAVQGPIWSNFELVQDFMVVLLTCKNEDDPIKNRGARVFTTLYIISADVQGQITLVLVVVSGRNLNSSKLSCMSSLLARMRLNKSSSSPKGNDRSPEKKQVFLNSSPVSKKIFQLVKGSQLCSPWLTKF